MGRLDDFLAEHPLFDRIIRVRSLVSDLQPDVREQVDAASPVGTISRLLSALDRTDSLLVTLDHDLVTPQMLTRVDSALQALEGMAGGLATESDPAALSPAIDTATDQLLDATSTWIAVPPISDDTARQLSEMVGSAAFERIAQIAAQLAQIDSQIIALESRPATIAEQLTATQTQSAQQIEQRIAALNAELDSVKTRLDPVVAEFQAQFSAAQDQRTTTYNALTAEIQSKADSTLQAIEQRIPPLTAALDAVKAQVESLAAGFQTQFTTEQTKREAEHAALQGDIKSKADASQAQIAKDAKSAAEKVRTDTDALMEEVSHRRDEVNRLFGVVSDTATSGGWGKEADGQRQQADRWRVVALIGGIAAVIFAFWALHSEGSSPSVGSSVTKVAVTAALGGIAAYAAQQSGDHRKREISGREKQLDLAAFGPFIAELDKERQQVVREDLAAKMFARQRDGNDVTIDAQHVSLPTRLLEDLIKRFFPPSSNP